MSDLPAALREALDAPNPPVFDDYDKTPERVYFRRDRARAMAAALRWAHEAAITADRPWSVLNAAIDALEQEGA